VFGAGTAEGEATGLVWTEGLDGFAGATPVVGGGGMTVVWADAPSAAASTAAIQVASLIAFTRLIYLGRRLVVAERPPEAAGLEADAVLVGTGAAFF